MSQIRFKVTARRDGQKLGGDVQGSREAGSGGRVAETPDENEMEPARIQRKRTKGYNLQAESLALNGLPCVYVGRPGRWGNPFKIAGGDTREDLIAAYRALLTLDYGWFKRHSGYSWMAGAIMTWRFKRLADIEEFVEPLRGKNLACWCSLSELCHADVLLEIANRVSSKEQREGK